MSDRRKQSVPEATRAEGIKMLQQSYRAREEMKPYAAERMAKRYGVSLHAIKNMRSRGITPRTMSAEVARKIRVDFMRFEELKKQYYSLDEIANHLEVGRTTVRHWASQEGLKDISKRPIAKAKLDKSRLWQGTPVGLFATMSLTSRPSEARYY